MASPTPVDSDLQRSMALQAGIHLISMAAKALLVLGGAVLLGEVVAGPRSADDQPWAPLRTLR